MVARELTKKFESFDAMTASDLPDWAQAHEPRGEYAVIVDMQDKNEEGLDAEDSQSCGRRAICGMKCTKSRGVRSAG